MLTFNVSDQRTLLGAMLRSLVATTFPAATVTFTEPEEHEWTGVKLSVESSGRWICVLPEASAAADVSVVLTAGTSGVLTMASTVEDFERAVGWLVNGGPTFVPPELLRVLATRADVRPLTQVRAVFANKPAEGSVRLTERERDVLQLVSAGRSNAEIATCLIISINTVRTHLRALVVKLDASSRTHLVANARAVGIEK